MNNESVEDDSREVPTEVGGEEKTVTDNTDMTTDSGVEAEEKTIRVSLLNVLGVLVATIPVLGYLGYLAAYMNERGFSGHFGFPSELITISWVTALPVIGSVAAFLAILVLSMSASMCCRPRRSQRCRAAWYVRIIISGVLAALTVVGLCFWIRYSLQPWWSALRHDLNTAVWVVAGLVWLSFAVEHWLLLEPIDDSPPKVAERRLFGLALRRQQMRAIMLASVPVVVMLFVWMPWYTGELQATAQAHFWIPSTNTNSVVLRIYGDRLICGEIVEKADGTNQLNGNFFVIRLDDTRPVLKLEEKGALRLPDG